MIKKKEKPVLKLLAIGSCIVRDLYSNKIEKHDPELTRTECTPGGKIYDIINGITNLNKIYHIKNIAIHVGGHHIPRDHPEKVEKS